MFGLFESQPFSDPQFGELKRSKGLWRTSITIDSSPGVLLAISGPRSAPDNQALKVAHAVLANYQGLRPVIEQALCNHFLPYEEAIAGGEMPPPPGGLPSSTNPNSVWPYVTTVYVSVAPMEGVLTAEIGYRTTWDEEHTLGARIQEGRFLELCGSVLEP